MGTPAWSEEEDEEEFRSHSGELGALDQEWLRRLGVNPTPVQEAYGLEPTDIYHIAKDLFGLHIRAVTFTDRPDTLTIYTRGVDDISVDWSLFSSTHSAVATLAGWQRTLAASRAARFLIGWCCASHLVGELEVALRIGFVPRSRNFTPPELQRLANTWQMLAHLLCPEERIVEQARTLGVPEGSLLRPDWRHRVAHYLPPPVLVGILAQRNHCLPLIIELQLDRYTGLPLLAHLFTRLMLEAPIFQLRASQAGKLLAKTAPLGTQVVDVRFSL